MALRFRGLDGPLETVYRKDSGSPPQAVDPYTQAAAQYGLSTGTALFNAGLNRTNQVNPMGSSTWSASYPGTSVPPSGGMGPVGGSGMPIGTAYNPPTTGNSASGPGASIPSFQSNVFGVPQNGVGGGNYFSLSPQPAAGRPYNGSPSGSAYGGAPTYTQTTALAPQFQSQLDKPIDTSGLAGMPGGPSTTDDLQTTRDALYKQQKQYLQPEQDLERSSLESKLANSGATVGSPAYNAEMDRLSREQEFQNSNARTQAITGGGAEQSRLFGLGSQGLQNQITTRDTPLKEWAALSGPSGGTSQALTPDISGAFGQQLQSQLAGYNAQTASNNATTQDATSLAALAAMYFMM